MNKKKVLSWVLLISWLLIIFLFSNQTGPESSNVSNEVLKIIEDITHIPLTSDLASFVIRKLAHFTEYAILGILCANLLKNYQKLTYKNLIWIFLCCALYAASDEFHQMFVGGRAPRLLDVAIDSCGSAVGILSYFQIFLYKKNKHKQ